MRKGQAAMEFLMTYGWAILVVLAAIGALAYFGILNPSRFLPDNCNIGAGFGCIEFKGDSGYNSSSGAMQLILQNNLGSDLAWARVRLEDTGATGCGNIAGTGVNSSGTTADYNFTNVRNGDRLNSGNAIIFGCTGYATEGAKASIQVEIAYLKAGETFDHAVTGEIRARMD